MTEGSPSLGLKARHYFALAFGSTVGVGWIVLVGTWLDWGGALGAVAAFLVAGLMLSVVVLVYAELAGRIPLDGGEVAYANAVFGRRAAFAVAWMLLLAYIGIAAFEAVSIGWLATALLPALNEGPLYTVNGAEISGTALAVGLSGTAALCWVNFRGVTAAARLQDAMTWALIGIGALFIGVGCVGGTPDNLRPLLPHGSGGTIAISTIALMFATAPFFLAGFNAAVQAIGQRHPSVPLKRVVGSLMAAHWAATLFYAGVALATALALPRPQLLADGMPAAAAFQAAFATPAARNLVLIAGLLGLLTTWNAVMIGAVQILALLARLQLVPPVFAIRHPRFGSYPYAIAFVGVGCAGGVLIGKSILQPVVSVSTVSYFFAFFMVAVALRAARRQGGPAPFVAPGGKATPILAAAISIAILAAALVLPAFESGHYRLPLDWPLLISWLVLGWGIATLQRRAADRGLAAVADTSR